MAVETGRRTTGWQALRPGGAFLVEPAHPGDLPTPERLNPEQRAIGDAIQEFIEREFAPRREKIEAKDFSASRELLEILGRDGYLGIAVPEAYGGAGLDTTTDVVVTEALG